MTFRLKIDFQPLSAPSCEKKNNIIKVIFSKVRHLFENSSSKDHNFCEKNFKHHLLKIVLNKLLSNEDYLFEIQLRVSLIEDPNKNKSNKLSAKFKILINIKREYMNK